MVRRYRCRRIRTARTPRHSLPLRPVLRPAQMAVQDIVST